MQADDFAAVCGSVSEVQAVAATVYNYSCIIIIIMLPIKP
jgi:hypothetical protein